ncbi:uncharacterized protein LTR77_005417 [Saxophila tyrrhenica]|uniref:Uncharacterized protein n=1 Tax=Saxophila tyrrhenica TaxID=1690608 RepID=A0AAV9P8F5_9PEZI|nr:hypothetical protein LTR77_005417 [Saxophila tyrrhenica]
MDAARFRKYIRVTTQTTVEQLFDMVQQNMNKRLSDQEVDEIELWPEGEEQFESFLVSKDDSLNWQWCVTELAKGPEDNLVVEGKVIL